MADEHVRSRDLGGGEQGVQICDEVATGARRRRGVAAAPGAVGGVVAARACGPRDLVLDAGPVRREPALEDDRGAPRARAAQEELARADVEAARIGAGDRHRRWRLRDLEAEDAIGLAAVEFDAHGAPPARPAL